MKAYKLIRKMKDGYSPLFIDKKLRMKADVWYMAKTNLEPKGFAHRPGWHACLLPLAPHLEKNLKSGEVRVWVEVETAGAHDFHERPESQGGTWLTCGHLRIVRELTNEEVEEILNVYAN